MEENFGKITIDSPTVKQERQGVTAQVSASQPSRPRRLTPKIEMIPELTPTEGEKFRSVELRHVLQLLGLPTYEDIKTDDMSILRSRLLRRGLRIGCYLPGKTTVSLRERVPLYLAENGEMSTRGTALVAIFMIAWMLSADKVNAAETAMVDKWIETKEFSESLQSAIPAISTFHWLIERKLVLSQARKRRISTLSRFQRRRESIMSFLLSIMANPEMATPRRMQRLETLYALVGLDPSNIHNDMHRLTSTVRQKTTTKALKGGAIDQSRLRAMTHDTEKAQDLLANVFEDEQSSIPLAEQSHSNKKRPILEILRSLSGRSEWSRDEIDSLSRTAGTTTGALLEQLNDLSYDTLDESVAEEDGEVVYIDQEIANKLISDSK